MKQQAWWRGAKGEWYVVVQLLLFGLVLLGPESLPSWPAWEQPWLLIGRIVGVILGGLGGLLAVGGVFSLGNSLTAVPRPKENAQLVKNGAYRWVRHPIYSGLIIGAFGLALMRASWLGLLYTLILFIFFDIKSRREEVWLREKYGEYTAYQQRVRKLIPFIY